MGGRDLWANTKRSERAVAMSREGRVFMGEYQTFRTFRTSDQNFLKKNAFYVLTSEKYGVIYPAGKNNKKKYNHYVCYIRTDDSDTN